MTIEATRRTLDFDWVESGGPAVTPPQAAGLRLAAAGIRAARADPGQGHASTTGRDGVRMHCTVPMPLEAADNEFRQTYPKPVPILGIMRWRYIALTMLSVIFLASPSSIMVLSR